MPFFTFMKAFQGLQDAPPEGSQGVLNTGTQTEHALQMRLPQQLFPVGNELRGSAKEGCHVVYKLWHQAGVGIVSLAIVISHDLQKGKHTHQSLPSRPGMEAAPLPA